MRKLLIIIISLLVLVGGAFGISALLSDDSSSSTNESDDQKRVEEKKEQLTEEEIEELTSKAREYWLVFQMNEELENFDNPDEELLSFFMIYSTGLFRESEITKEELNDQYVNLFGKHHKYEIPNSIDCMICGLEGAFTYNENTKQYEPNLEHLGHGLEWSIATLDKVFYVDGYKQGEDYVIEGKVLFSGLYGGWYIEGFSDETLGTGDETADEIYEKYNDKLDAYKFTFIKEDENFILKKVRKA